MNVQDKIQRTVLPIPDQPHVGLTTCDAKDPETNYPPIQELRPLPHSRSSARRSPWRCSDRFSENQHGT